MFIVTTKDGKVFKEGKIIGLDKSKNQIYQTWDLLPKNIRIRKLQLTYPFKVRLSSKKGKQSREYAPNLGIGTFDRYYFSNESTVKMAVFGDKQVQTGVPQLEAKIIAGIDDKLKEITELRLDKHGNCNLSRFSLKSLEARIEAKTFRKEIIRKGI